MEKAVALEYRDGCYGRIGAVKMLRERLGLGLKEAKDIVDDFLVSAGKYRKVWSEEMQNYRIDPIPPL